MTYDVIINDKCIAQIVDVDEDEGSHEAEECFARVCKLLEIKECKLVKKYIHDGVIKYNVRWFTICR